MTNLFKELKYNNYITEKQFKKAISLFLAEKLQEGYYLTEENIMSVNYQKIYVLENDNNERFGLGVKMVCVDFSYNYFDITIQWGKLKDSELFDFEDEEKATVETFKAVGYYHKNVYYNEEKFEEIVSKKEQRAKNKYYNKSKSFIAKKLNIKGLKREKDIKVVKVVNWENENIAYNIFKNNNIYKIISIGGIRF